MCSRPTRATGTPPDLGLYRRPDTHPLPFVLAMTKDGPWSTNFVCGYFGCDALPFNPLIEALPVQVLAKRPKEGNHIEVDLINSALQESETRRDGGETVLSRLSELLLVRVLRRHIEEMPENSVGWLAGLRDPHISRALSCIHAQPERQWTLAELSRVAGLSRSNFADRFGARVGTAPIQYLKKWRLQLASGIAEADQPSGGEHRGSGRLPIRGGFHPRVQDQRRYAARGVGGASRL